MSRLAVAARTDALSLPSETMQEAYLKNISPRRTVSGDDIAATAFFRRFARRPPTADRNITGKAISVDGNVEYP